MSDCEKAAVFFSNALQAMHEKAAQGHDSSAGNHAGAHTGCAGCPVFISSDTQEPLS